MQHLGEIISLAVAVSWTATALFADTASRRLGPLHLNLIRMALSLIMLAILLWCVAGYPFPQYADGKTWLWLSVSGVVGYVLGDICLFNSYVLIGSRYGQLFMTIAPPIAGIAGWLFMGEIMSAGAGQGLGLVLSKIGMEHYQSVIPSDCAESFRAILSFSGTFIRATAGLLCFFIIVLFRRSLREAVHSLSDKKGMSCAVLTTFFGPFLGVSLSLMAVQKAEAGIASTLMALTPVLIIVPYSIIHHQKISLKEVIGTAVTMTGIALFFM